MELRFDADGLIAAVLVDAATGEVLTLAYMNAEALARTRETGETWLWSRSRRLLWHKGATSGHTQQVVSIAPDCDGDALVVRVRPRGPACHTGARSCFAAGAAGGALVELDDLLARRADERPEGSYTTRLLADANLRVKKIGEEQAELLAALVAGEDGRAVEEAADLVYHVAVALRARGIPLSALARELLDRAR